MAIKNISDFVDAVVVDRKTAQLEQEVQLLKQQLSDKHGYLKESPMTVALWENNTEEHP